jgi:DNA-directed RNA polymerase II subunit RPB3
MLCLRYPALDEKILGSVTNAGLVGDIAAYVSFSMFLLSLLLLSSFFYVNYQVTVCDGEAYTYDDEVIKKAEAMGKPGLVEINAKEDSFIFTVETTGAITAYELIMNAITVLRQKLDAVRLQDDDGDLGELGAHLGGP